MLEPAVLTGLEYLLGWRPAPGSALAETGPRSPRAAGAGLPPGSGTGPAVQPDPAPEDRWRAALAAWQRLPLPTRALVAALWPAGEPLGTWLRQNALASLPLEEDGPAEEELAAGREPPLTAVPPGCAARESLAGAAAADPEEPAPVAAAPEEPAAGAAGSSGREGAGGEEPAGSAPGGTTGGPGPRPAASWLEAVEQVFSPGGPLSQLLPGYRLRPGQVRMARAVAEALAQGRHLAVEAGTGIGKTMAYLVPAVLWARQHRGRVVVATYTIALQEQLRTRDLPLLHRVVPVPFTSAVLKGFSQYACRLQAEATLRDLARPGSSLDAALGRAAARLAVWLEQTETGDASELQDPAVAALWPRFSTEPGACLGPTCPLARHCFPLRARERAQSADLVVANHALLLADRASEHRVLPEYDALIVDEAHHLEDVAAQQLGIRIRPAETARFLATWSGAGGPAGDPSNGTPGGRARGRPPGGNRPDTTAPAAGHLPQAGPEEVEAASALREVDAALRRLLDMTRSRPEEGAARLPASWPESPPGRQLAAALRGAGEALQAVLARLEAAPPAADEAAFLAARRLRQRLQATAEAIARCLDADGWCLWIEAAGRDTLQLSAAPIDASDLLAPWFEVTPTVFTSATLPRGSHWLDRLGVRGAAQLEIPSPYDYRRQALLAIATDVPRPPARVSDAYLDELARRVCAVAEVVPGGILVLFTARAVLAEVAARVRGPLAERGRRLAVQDEDGPRGALVTALREGTIDVLFGVDSLWEGIDVPGDRLQAVVVTRLPFDPPADPLTAARCEALEAAGGSAFFQYQLPRAGVKLKQGFGRLVRGHDDRGVVVVFDPRLAPGQSGYARWLLETLPPAARVTGSTGAVIEAIRAWLGGRPA